VLGAILAMATTNLQAPPVSSPTQQAFETITRAAERGAKMVRSLLSFARQNPAEERELDLNMIIREEVRLLERTTLAKVRLALELASDLRPIRGDASALTNAFMNLCLNAVDAMPAQGTLTLRTRNMAPSWVEVDVEDTGTGMTQEVQAKALDPFFTTKPVGMGTGLGLSMVFSTVKAHQGQLEIWSQPGQGTRICLRFPACKPSNLPLVAVEPRETAAVGSRKVLLVDDDELIRGSVQALLEVLGHQVTVAASGEEALALLQTGLEPDVVILDMNMPGLGGGGTLPALRTLRPSLRVLLSTGRTDQTALNLVAAFPNVTLLSKPFTMEDLRQRIQQAERGV